MSGALKDYVILGIMTNLGYLKRIMDNEKFLSGDYHTHFIDDNEKALRLSKGDLIQVLAGIALVSADAESSGVRIPGDTRTEYTSTPWQELGDWKICGR